MKEELNSISASVAGSQSPIMREPGEKSEDEKKSRSDRLVCLVAVLLVAVIGLVVAMVIITNQPDTDKDTARVVMSQGQEVCQTPGCAIAAANVLEAMDMTADPCEDFYEYACGAWRRTNLIPEDASTFHPFFKLHLKNEVVKKYLLEDKNADRSFTAIRKALDFYDSCMNIELIDGLGRSPAITLLEELGGWPILGSNPGGNWDPSTFDLVQLLIKVNLYNFSPLMNIYVTKDSRNVDTRILYLDQPILGMPSRNYYLQPELEATRTAHATLAVEVAVELGADRSQAVTDTTAMMELETEIANLSMPSEERRDSNALYNNMTIGQLKERFPEPSASDPIQFSWTRFVKGLMMSERVNVTVSDNEKIVIKATPYFEKLMTTLQKYDKRTIANHVVWRLIGVPLNGLGTKFEDLLFEYNKVVFGIAEKQVRWSYCQGLTTYYFPMAVSHMFVQQSFQVSAKAEVQDMIAGLQDAFKAILQNTPWMDDASRLKAMEKVEVMNQRVGFPSKLMDETYVNDLNKNYEVSKDEYYRNRLNGLKTFVTESLADLRKPVKKGEWIADMSKVNAYYSFYDNAIMFPAGIFQPPFYAEDRLQSMNYGAIGFLIGHEITHGFDDMGRQFDKDGNLAMWWDSATIDNFKAQTNCMIDQYSNYTVPEAGLKLNGINTQGENIADNGGVKESYMAYRNWVTNRGQEEAKLPGVDLSPDKLFFISYAQIFCENMNKQEAIWRVNTASHSPGRFRVIGTLQNSPDFARVFQCANNTFMNPPSKCSVW